MARLAELPYNPITSVHGSHHIGITMPEEQYRDSDPQSRAHPRPAPWAGRHDPLPEPLPQHDDCEAIGSVLNGSYKTRWHTKRAGAMWVLGSLTGFSASMAVGAASLLAAIVSLGFGAATMAVYRIERKQRRLRTLSPATSPESP